MPIIGLPGLTSAITTVPYTHADMWYERNANKLGDNYFDMHYGSGAEGYYSESPDYFDLEWFQKGANASLGHKYIYGHPNMSRTPSAYYVEKKRTHILPPFIYFIYVLSAILALTI